MGVLLIIRETGTMSFLLPPHQIATHIVASNNTLPPSNSLD